MSTLSIQGVGRMFPGVNGGQPTLALEPTGLDVAHNDFITILGPSGCGKSTLLRIVAGLDTPTVGQVRLDGQPVTGPGADRGMVFQSYTLFPWLTVRARTSASACVRRACRRASRPRSRAASSPKSG